MLFNRRNANNGIGGGNMFGELVGLVMTLAAMMYKWAGFQGNGCSISKIDQAQEVVPTSRRMISYLF